MPENPYASDTRCLCPDDWRELFDKARCPQHGGAAYESERSKYWREGFAAGRAAAQPVPLSDLCTCEACGHTQAEPNWCHKCGHRTTIPEWAKALLAAWEIAQSAEVAREDNNPKPKEKP